MRREGNTLSALLRSAWDGSTLEVMTRNKSKLRASNAHLSMIAHITPEELQKQLQQKNSVEIYNGFSNRFLWCLVRSTKSLPNGGNVSVLNDYHDRYVNAIDQAKKLSTLERSIRANELWESVYDELKRSKSGAYGKTVERGRPQVVRLSMIYAMLDGSPIVKHPHLRAALAVWRYCDHSARILFSDDVVRKLESDIVDHIAKNPGVNKTELKRSTGHNLMTSIFDDALAFVESNGDIIRVPVFGKRQADTFYKGLGFRQDGDENDDSSEDESFKRKDESLKPTAYATRKISESQY